MCGRFTPITHDELSAIVADIERDRATGRDTAGMRFAPVPAEQPAPPQPSKQGTLFDLDDADAQGSSEPVRDAFPKSIVPVIVDGANGLQTVDLRWGYAVDWKSSGPVFNARCERAVLPDSMWNESLLHRRCIVAVRAFFEPHATQTRISPHTGRAVKQAYRFTMAGEDVLFLAGVWQEDSFSVMTCAPNRWVAPVHDRMPLVLRRGELVEWIDGDYRTLFDRSDVQLAAAAVSNA